MNIYYSYKGNIRKYSASSNNDNNNKVWNVRASIYVLHNWITSCRLHIDAQRNLKSSFELHGLRPNRTSRTWIASNDLTEECINCVRKTKVWMKIYQRPLDMFTTLWIVVHIKGRHDRDNSLFYVISSKFHHISISIHKCCVSWLNEKVNCMVFQCKISNRFLYSWLQRSCHFYLFIWFFCIGIPSVFEAQSIVINSWYFLYSLSCSTYEI